MPRRTVAAVALAVALLAVAAPASAATPRSAEYWLTDYGVTAAWSTTKGAGVTVAVIDTGIGRPADLAGAVVGGTDFSGRGSADGRTPVGSKDPQHGTLVASVLAARGGAGGMVGVAPEASLLAVSIGTAADVDDSDDEIAKAVRWSVDHGASVISMSLSRGTKDWPRSWDDAFLYAAGHDVVVVAAAGNRAGGEDEVGAPATMPGVLAVGGLTTSGAASSGSSTQGITIAVAAPAERLVGALPGGGYVYWSGSSGATPIVAGVVALVRAAHPDLDAANVIERVIATAHDAGAAGVDPLYGYGRVDAESAVRASVPRVDANPLGSLADWVRTYRRADGAPPTVTATPVPVASGSAAVPAIERDGTAWRAWGIPTVLVALLVAALVAAAVAMALRVKRSRRSG